MPKFSFLGQKRQWLLLLVVRFFMPKFSFFELLSIGKKVGNEILIKYDPIHILNLIFKENYSFFLK